MNRYITSLLSVAILGACSHQGARLPANIQHEGGFQCKAPVVFKGQSLTTCEVETKSGETKAVHLLNLKGKSTDIHYAQGHLLAPEIGDGSIGELLSNFRDIPSMTGKNGWLFRTVKQCYLQRITRSVDEDFLKTIDAMADGYHDGMLARGLTPRWNREDFREAILGIDLGNILGGLIHEMDASPLKGVKDLFGACGIKVTGAAIKQLTKKFKRTVKTEDSKMGCVGVAMSSHGTVDGKLLHGRNLDQTPLMDSWTKAPVLYLIHEDGHHKYMGTGTAGLIFPAGISGMNEHGLSATLHQMNTTRFDSLHRKRDGVIMPYLQQRMMREATTIDEAFALAKKFKAFSAWTIFITDSKTNEVASIELSPKHVTIARRNKDLYMAQSNHFLAPDMQKEHFHDTYNNVLESQSRLYITERELKKNWQKADVHWMMRHLTLHEDYFEGERSFGRGPVKASNVMSSIAIPEDGIYWMTIGDRKPAAHSQYIAVKADWNSAEMIPFATGRSDRYASRPNYEASFHSYVESYYLNSKGDKEGAIKKLEEARELALKDGVHDSTYAYNLARLKHINGNAEEAYELIQELWARRAEFHPYQQALFAMYLARMGQDQPDESKRLNDKEAVDLYEWSLNEFEKLKLKSPYGHASPNFEDKISVLKKWAKGKEAEVPSLSFAVID